MTDSLAAESITSLAPLLEQKIISPVDLMTSVFRQIEEKNELLCAYTETFEQDALSQAKQAEKEIISGNYLGKLHGIPLAIKDNLYVKGKRVRIGSKIHENFIPEYNAAVVDKLTGTGMILTGMVNMHEYAYGFTTTNPYYGTCRNPWDVERIPGGSSGGSAVAVAADMTIASLGTETGGSLRSPASFNGIISIKPTYGLVSNHGCFPLSWSLDHIGPMTKTVADAALLLDVMTELPSTASYTKALDQDIRGMKIGINEEYLFANVDEQVDKLVRKVLLELEKQGAEIIPVDFHTFDEALFAFMMTMAAEASALHKANLIKCPEDFGIEVRTELLFGQLISATDYLKAQQIRAKIRAEFELVFQQVDVIVGPTLPHTASFIGSDLAFINNEEVKLVEHVSRFIRPTTLAGIPAMSIPCGLADGLPVGMQILAGPYMERNILKLASAVEDMKLMGDNKPKF